jgi:hypothetical protein
MATLPDLGMNGIVNSVRRLSGLANPGYRDVDENAEFIAGCVAKLEANSDGVPVLMTADADDTNLIGLFYCHKTLSFYKPIIEEEQTYGDSPNTAFIVYLKHANLKTGSVIVSDGTTAYTVTTDYSLSTTNGTVTRTSTGAIGATDTIYVSYLYQDPNLVGIDQTLGSRKAATLEDAGEVATLVYDTGVSYTLMGNVYSNATGYITSTNGGGSIVGVVTKVPTAEDPELHFKLKI